MKKKWFNKLSVLILFSGLYKLTETKYLCHLHWVLTGAPREAREKTRNKTKTSKESPCHMSLPVILSLVSELEASHFFHLKPDTHIPLQLTMVGKGDRSAPHHMSASWDSTRASDGC